MGCASTLVRSRAANSGGGCRGTCATLSLLRREQGFHFRPQWTRRWKTARCGRPSQRRSAKGPSAEGHIGGSRSRSRNRNHGAGVRELLGRAAAMCNRQRRILSKGRESCGRRWRGTAAGEASGSPATSRPLIETVPSTSPFPPPTRTVGVEQGKDNTTSIRSMSDQTTRQCGRCVGDGVPALAAAAP